MIEEMLSKFGDKIPYEPNFKALLYGDCAVYLENVTGLIGYSPDEISLSTKRGGVIVRGKDMCVKKYCAGDVLICGRILGLERR